MNKEKKGQCNFKKNDFYASICRLARRRASYRATRDAMSAEKQEAGRQVRRERHAARTPEQQVQRQSSQQHASNYSSQSVPLDFNYPEVIQRIGAFHRNLSSFKNVFCIVCKECFPTTTTSEAGVCHHCHTVLMLSYQSCFLWKIIWTLVQYLLNFV